MRARVAIHSRGRILGVDHPATLRTRSNLGVVLQNKGDVEGARVLLEEAVVIQREVIELRRGIYGDGSAREADSLMEFAYMMVEFERWTGIEEAGSRALAIREQLPNVDEVALLEARHILMSVIVNQGRFADAEQRAVRYYEHAVRLEDSGRATHTAGKLVKIYEGLENDAEAAPPGRGRVPARKHPHR